MIQLDLRSALLANLADLEPGDQIAVGLSGGGDSVALLKAAVHVGNEKSFVVTAIIIDHQLQADSGAVAEQAAQIAKDLGTSKVEIVKVQVATGSGSGGLEAAARNARRDVFESYASVNNVKAVLLGHTLEDQAETVLLGLARGSGARSLSGMRAIDGIYRRPFLNLTRELVRSTVTDLATFEDPHNSDPSFTRVRVRQTVLPVLEKELGPGVAQALGRTADMLRDDADALDMDAAMIFAAGEPTINELEKLSKAVRTRVLRHLAIRAGVLVNDLSREHILNIDNLITNWHGQGSLNLPGQVNVKRESGKLIFYTP
jgi:tRNA(Ile)-lysidine synthase